MKAFDIDNDRRRIVADGCFELHNALNKIISETALGIADGSIEIRDGVISMGDRIIFETSVAMQELAK